MAEAATAARKCGRLWCSISLLEVELADAMDKGAGKGTGGRKEGGEVCARYEGSNGEGGRLVSPVCFSVIRT